MPLFVAMVLLLNISVSFAAEGSTKTLDPGSGGTAAYYPNGSPVVIGEMLVTNSTSSAGLTGHSGIVTSNFKVAHIAGYGYHPEELTLDQWFARYPNTKRVRNNTTSTALYIGRWAASYVSQYPYANYGLATKLQGMDPTYCSKIVWQSYYYGSGVAFLGYRPDSTAIFAPYDILRLSNTTTQLVSGSDF
ncbi:hypothetical protein [Effusibacillus pohliae]|uniref:hypothetical protein n=1 Tax=Effusibacillus pohliae TaxID=232270 RepID=UPI0012EA57F4|nr:hypothetical protein [Effusibacillus pohliae]